MKGHSERVPMKNIRDLVGRPLFCHLGDTLRDTGLFESLVINTDSYELANLATQRYGNWVRIIERPEEICGDHVSMNSILEHDVKLLGLHNDFFQTHSTSPLLSAATISSAVNLYLGGKREDQFDSLFSVSTIRSRLYDADLNPLNHDPTELKRTQDLPTVFEENSGFYVFSGNSFFAKNHRIGERPRAYQMNRNSVECIDIDEMRDWELVEKLLLAGLTHDR
jgi:CMP-N-acetylneuraminic acid synthetase